MMEQVVCTKKQKRILATSKRKINIRNFKTIKTSYHKVNFQAKTPRVSLHFHSYESPTEKEEKWNDQS